MEIFESALHQTDEEQIVVFNIATESFGLSINCIDNIIKLSDITPVPNAKSYIEGLINLRGKIIVVVDLVTKMGFKRKESNSDTRIIVVDIHGDLMGIRVDSVSETIRIQKEDIRPPPPLITQKLNSEYVVGVTQHGDNDILTLIDIARLFDIELQQKA